MEVNQIKILHENSNCNNKDTITKHKKPRKILNIINFMSEANALALVF